MWAIAFSPDGSKLISGSAAILSVAFSADGQRLASGGEDESIQLWDIQKCRRLQQLKSDRLYEGMKITGISGLTDAEKASLKALGAVEKGDCLPV